MENEEFEKLKRNQGGLLAFNTFLSTSSDRDISIQYAMGALGDPNGTAILFEFDLQTSNYNQHASPFASLEHISYFEWENEILFSMHTIFSIQEINEMDSGIWHARLIITNEDDEQLRQLTDHLEEHVGGSGLRSVLDLMIRISEPDKALSICQTILQEISTDDNFKIGDIHVQMGWCCIDKHDLNAAQKHLETAIEIFTPNFLFMIPIFCRSGLGRIFHLQGKYDLALREYESFLKIDIMERGFDQIIIFDIGYSMIVFANLYFCVASLLQDMRQYKRALEMNERTLKICHRAGVLTIDPYIVTIYVNIALCHMHMENYELALPYLERTLELYKRSLRKNHPFIAIVHYNIAYCLKYLFVSRHQFDLIFEIIEHSRYAFEIAQTSPDLNPNLPVYQELWNESQAIIQDMENR